MSNQLFVNDIISYTFVTELSTHANCFVEFYQLIEKQLCLETLEFFFMGIDYKLSPACLRIVTEKQIFEYFVANKARRQINISDKMRKAVESHLGFGKSNIFDECILHCAESLSTNFWLDFSKQLRATPPEKKQKSLSKDALTKLVPKYMQNPILTFFGKKTYKIPNFFLQNDRDLKHWLVRTDPEQLTDLIIGILKIDPDLYFTQNVIRVLADRSVVIQMFLSDCLRYAQRHSDNTVWRVKSGFPLEVLLYFIFYCGKKELNKGIKKIVDNIYDDWSQPKPQQTKVEGLEAKKVLLYIQQILNELIKQKDDQFKKVRIMLHLVNYQCRKVYGKEESDEWILRHGVLQIMLRYVIRCLDEPFLVGAHPSTGCFARPIINIIIDIFNMYTQHPSVVGSLEYKPDWFKDLYEQFLKLPDDTLAKFNKYYANLIDCDSETAILDYNKIVINEYNKLGYGGIGDCFLYEDEIMFIGQHLVSLGSNVGERTKELQKFLDENKSMTDLRLCLKKLKFPDPNDTKNQPHPVPQSKPPPKLMPKPVESSNKAISTEKSSERSTGTGDQKSEDKQKSEESHKKHEEVKKDDLKKPIPDLRKLSVPDPAKKDQFIPKTPKGNADTSRDKGADSERSGHEDQKDQNEVHKPEPSLKVAGQRKPRTSESSNDKKKKTSLLKKALAGNLAAEEVNSSEDK